MLLWLQCRCGKIRAGIRGLLVAFLISACGLPSSTVPRLDLQESDLLACGIVSHASLVVDINGFGIVLKIVDAAIDLRAGIVRRENRQHYTLSRIACHRVDYLPNEGSGLG